MQANVKDIIKFGECSASFGGSNHLWTIITGGDSGNGSFDAKVRKDRTTKYYKNKKKLLFFLIVQR